MDVAGLVADVGALIVVVMAVEATIVVAILLEEATAVVSVVGRGATRPIRPLFTTEMIPFDPRCGVTWSVFEAC